MPQGKVKQLQSGLRDNCEGTTSANECRLLRKHEAPKTLFCQGKGKHMLLSRTSPLLQEILMRLPWLSVFNHQDSDSGQCSPSHEVWKVVPKLWLSAEDAPLSRKFHMKLKREELKRGGRPASPFMRVDGFNVILQFLFHLKQQIWTSAQTYIEADHQCRRSETFTQCDTVQPVCSLSFISSQLAASPYRKVYSAPRASQMLLLLMWFAWLGLCLDTACMRASAITGDQRLPWWQAMVPAAW